MARLKINPNLDKYTKKLEQLQFDTRDKIIGKAVYEGAGIVADAVRANINALTTSNDFHEAVTPKQKEGLLSGLGISRMKDENGFINVKVGFNGYNSIRNKRYPNGQPNALVARSLEKGTSVAPAQRFVAPAVKRAQASAENAMQEIVESEIDKIMN